MFDWFYKQLVTSDDLDEAFANLEEADHNLVADQGYFGVYNGMGVTQQTVPDLTVRVAPGDAYDQQGRRVSIPNVQNVDLSVDSNAASTAVSTPGNEKWVSLFVRFARSLSDQRFDGDANPVFFRRDESFEFLVTQGAEAPIGTATRPSLESDALLIADVLLVNAQTQITDADIESDDVATDPDSRFEFAFNLTASSPAQIRVGPIPDAMQAILTELNNHIADVANAHDASAVGFDETNLPIPVAWSATATANDVQAALDGIVADLGQTTGTTGSELVGYDASAVPAGLSALAASTELQGALDGLVDDLAQDTGTTGAANIGHDGPGGSTWADSSALAAQTVAAAIDGIIDALADGSGPDGAGRIGYDPSGATNLTSINVADALDELDSEKGGLATNNVWTGTSEYQNGLSVTGGSVALGTDANPVSTTINGANLAWHDTQLEVNGFGRAGSEADWVFAQNAIQNLADSGDGAQVMFDLVSGLVDGEVGVIKMELFGWSDSDPDDRFKETWEVMFRKTGGTVTANGQRLEAALVLGTINVSITIGTTSTTVNLTVTHNDVSALRANYYAKWEYIILDEDPPDV